MTAWLDYLLALAALPACVGSGYLFVLTLLSGRTQPPPPPSSWPRFRFIVPAHDEQAGIAATVESLRGVDYPHEAFDVQVVADNCSDATAERARAAGALVLERQDREQRGKGYALHHAFERLPEDVVAVVVIDADTLVSPNLLRAFAARLAQGANAIQADYAVRNVNDAWRTRLMAIALGAFHIVRSRGRERLQVSCGLRGNGMCFTRALLNSVPHHAYSIVEDVEYGLRLAEAGHRVFYADEAHVYGEMVSSAKAATSQRRRWEEGRSALKRAYAGRLLRRALAERSALHLDLLLDMRVPPLSRLVLLVAAGLGCAAAGALWLHGFALSLAVWGCCALAIVCYVLRGWMLSGTGARGLVDLLGAPFYVAWKLTLRRVQRPGATKEWVRTTREAESDVKRSP